MDTTDMANHCAFCGDENPKGQPFRRRIVDYDNTGEIELLPECQECHETEARRAKRAGFG